MTTLEQKTKDFWLFSTIYHTKKDLMAIEAMVAMLESPALSNRLRSRIESEIDEVEKNRSLRGT